MNKALFLKGLALASVILLSACERPPMDSVQRGYRGTGMVQARARSASRVSPTSALFTQESKIVAERGVVQIQKGV